MLDPEKHREMQERKHAYARAREHKFLWRERRQRMFWLGVSILIVLVDQLSKWHVTQNVFFPRMFGQNGQGFVDWMVDAPSRLPYYYIPITSYFNLVMAWNTGVSFSMFSGGGGYTYLILIAVALVIVCFFLYFLWKSENHFHGLCYAAVIGGALGNVIDRARFGAVIDFLDFHLYGWHWPAFNVADMSIVVGILVLIFGSLIFDLQKKSKYRKKMKQKRRLKSFIAMFVVIPTALSGCGNVRNTLGLNKDSPDEFTVLTRAPLEVPPHLILPTPVPGQPRPQEEAALEQAQRAVFGKPAQENSQISSSEDGLLQKTGAISASSDIRATVNNETKELAERNVAVAEKINPFGGDRQPSATVVDAKAELERLRANQASSKAINEGETPFIEE